MKFPSPKSASAPWLCRAALCALALAAYANSFGLGLAYDGAQFATADARVQSVTWSNLSVIFSKPYWYPVPEDYLYRPLTILSFLFNHAILGNGSDPAGYHWLNFLLHAAAVLLLFELARRLFAEVGLLPAFLAAALWAVHPIGTEAVANLAGRADLLAAVFLLAALVLYTRPRRTRFTPVYLFFLALAGALSKETAFVLPALLLLCDLSLTAGGSSSSAKPNPRWPSYAAVLAALAAVLLIRRAIFASQPWPQTEFLDNPLRAAGFFAARLTALKILGRDLSWLVWPAHLSFDYSYNQIPLARWRDPLVWLVLALVAEILIVVTLRRRRDPVLFFAAGFYGITILPASNLIVLIASVAAVRFSYLPSAAFAIAVAALAFRLPSRRLACLILGVITLLCAARTFARNPAWDSDLALGAADVRTAPASFRTHRLLANALFKQDPGANLDAAIREAEAAWDILASLPPVDSSPHAAADLGLFYELKAERAGGPRTPSGRAWYERALAVLESGAAMAEAQRQAFARAQVAHGRPSAWLGAFDLLYLNLGKAYAALGRCSEAEAAFHQSLRNNPAQQQAASALAALPEACPQ